MEVIVEPWKGQAGARDGELSRSSLIKPVGWGIFDVKWLTESKTHTVILLDCCKERHQSIVMCLRIISRCPETRLLSP